MPEYALILILLLFISVFLHRYFKLKLSKSKSHLFIFYAILFFVGIVWDQFAIGRNHWTYSEEFLLGPYVGFMPIEDYVFILVTPYFGLVVYKIIEKYLKN
ncbi:hypothetical protein AMJ51_00865 [Microgenomates bacterium DG_75]|nr:MAG: hypothetical protein AMJ51_00865 [Microgenomates bacterium DG_75]